MSTPQEHELTGFAAFPIPANLPLSNGGTAGSGSFAGGAPNPKNGDSVKLGGSLRQGSSIGPHSNTTAVGGLGGQPGPIGSVGETSLRPRGCIIAGRSSRMSLNAALGLPPVAVAPSGGGLGGRRSTLGTNSIPIIGQSAVVAPSFEVSKKNKFEDDEGFNDDEEASYRATTIVKKQKRATISPGMFGGSGMEGPLSSGSVFAAGGGGGIGMSTSQKPPMFGNRMEGSVRANSIGGSRLEGSVRGASGGAGSPLIFATASPTGMLSPKGNNGLLSAGHNHWAGGRNSMSVSQSPASTPATQGLQSPGRTAAELMRQQQLEDAERDLQEGEAESEGDDGDHEHDKKQVEMFIRQAADSHSDDDDDHGRGYAAGYLGHRDSAITDNRSEFGEEYDDEYYDDDDMLDEDEANLTPAERAERYRQMMEAERKAAIRRLRSIQDDLRYRDFASLGLRYKLAGIIEPTLLGDTEIPKKWLMAGRCYSVFIAIFALLHVVAACIVTTRGSKSSGEALFIFTTLVAAFDFVARCVTFAPRTSVLGMLFDLIILIASFLQLGHAIENDYAIYFAILRGIRTMRVISLFEAYETCRDLFLVYRAIAASLSSLMVVAAIFVIGLLLFSTAVWMLDQSGFDQVRELRLQQCAFEAPCKNRLSPFQSIPNGMWLIVNAMSTVGLGDTIPNNTISRIFTGIGMVAGVFMIAFPSMILVANLQQVRKNYFTSVERRRTRLQVLAVTYLARREQAEALRAQREAIINESQGQRASTATPFAELGSPAETNLFGDSKRGSAVNPLVTANGTAATANNNTTTNNNNDGTDANVTTPTTGGFTLGRNKRASRASSFVKVGGANTTDVPPAATSPGLNPFVRPSDNHMSGWGVGARSGGGADASGSDAAIAGVDTATNKNAAGAGAVTSPRPLRRGRSAANFVGLTGEDDAAGAGGGGDKLNQTNNNFRRGFNMISDEPDADAPPANRNALTRVQSTVSMKGDEGGSPAPLTRKRSNVNSMVGFKGGDDAEASFVGGGHERMLRRSNSNLNGSTRNLLGARGASTNNLRRQASTLQQAILEDMEGEGGGGLGGGAGARSRNNSDDRGYSASGKIKNDTVNSLAHILGGGGVGGFGGAAAKRQSLFAGGAASMMERFGGGGGGGARASVISNARASIMNLNATLGGMLSMFGGGGAGAADRSMNDRNMSVAFDDPLKPEDLDPDFGIMYCGEALLVPSQRDSMAALRKVCIPNDGTSKQAHGLYPGPATMPFLPASTNDKSKATLAAAVGNPGIAMSEQMLLYYSPICKLLTGAGGGAVKTTPKVMANTHHQSPTDAGADAAPLVTNVVILDDDSALFTVMLLVDDNFARTVATETILTTIDKQTSRGRSGLSCGDMIARALPVKGLEIVVVDGLPSNMVLLRRSDAAEVVNNQLPLVFLVRQISKYGILSAEDRGSAMEDGHGDDDDESPLLGGGGNKRKDKRTAISTSSTSSSNTGNSTTLDGRHIGVSIAKDIATLQLRLLFRHSEKAACSWRQTAHVNRSLLSHADLLRELRAIAVNVSPSLYWPHHVQKTVARAVREKRSNVAFVRLEHVPIFVDKMLAHLVAGQLKEHAKHFSLEGDAKDDELRKDNTTIVITNRTEIQDRVSELFAFHCRELYKSEIPDMIHSAIFAEPLVEECDKLLEVNIDFFRHCTWPLGQIAVEYAFTAPASERLAFANSKTVPAGVASPASPIVPKVANRNRMQAVSTFVSEDNFEASFLHATGEDDDDVFEAIFQQRRQHVVQQLAQSKMMAAAAIQSSIATKMEENAHNLNAAKSKQTVKEIEELMATDPNDMFYGNTGNTIGQMEALLAAPVSKDELRARKQDYHKKLMQSVSLAATDKVEVAGHLLDGGDLLSEEERDDIKKRTGGIGHIPHDPTNQRWMYNSLIGNQHQPEALGKLQKSLGVTDKDLGLLPENTLIGEASGALDGAKDDESSSQSPNAAAKSSSPRQQQGMRVQFVGDDNDGGNSLQQQPNLARHADPSTTFTNANGVTISIAGAPDEAAEAPKPQKPAKRLISYGTGSTPAAIAAAKAKKEKEEAEYFDRILNKGKKAQELFLERKKVQAEAQAKAAAERAEAAKREKNARTKSGVSEWANGFKKFFNGHMFQSSSHKVEIKQSENAPKRKR